MYVTCNCRTYCIEAVFKVLGNNRLKKKDIARKEYRYHKNQVLATGQSIDTGLSKNSWSYALKLQSIRRMLHVIFIAL